MASGGRRQFAAVAACIFVQAAVHVARAAPLRVELDHGWELESSARVKETGSTLSLPTFHGMGWAVVALPNTVVGALVDAGHLPDPYRGTALRSLPGMGYAPGALFDGPMPADSPFRSPWWFRKVFELPELGAGRHLWLRFDGVNYRANVWVNGRRIASADEMVGAFRRYEYDVTGAVNAGRKNAVAVEIFPPGTDALAFTWIDWNPTPPDKNMGLWDGVSLADSGALTVRHPQVSTELSVPLLDRARLTITAEVENATDRVVQGVVRGAIEDIAFARAIVLAPHEHTTVRFSPDTDPNLVLSKPRVWWPYRMGRPDLYSLKLWVEEGGAISDSQELLFGIRRVSSEMTARGHRLFKINGKRLLVRGGGWAPDMLLRPKSRERLESELRYVRELGLNTIRLEGKPEDDRFFELTDQYGILVMTGFPCCSQWEDWDEWMPGDSDVAVASLRDQLLRLRNHPSVLAWLNGSDRPPPPKVERAYREVERAVNWQVAVLSNASERPGPVTGSTGVKMRGPYEYVPPAYWLLDNARGGAFGFATEVAPGAAIPPVESVEAMLSPDHLWPVDAAWALHGSSAPFDNLGAFVSSLEARYGKATSPGELSRKAQAIAYEGERAMFEAYGRNRYRSTGVIVWMLNNAWPSMTWHLYDYYLRPGGGFFGTKKGCEALHVQFSYDDRSVVVVNDLLEPSDELVVTAELLDFELAPLFRKRATLTAEPDSVTRVFRVPRPRQDGRVQFLRLELADSSGDLRSRNFYWLPARDDVLDWKNASWHHTPTKVNADLSALSQLDRTTLRVFVKDAENGARTSVGVENDGTSLAFQVHLRLLERKSGREILPVYWEDNYFELMPGESRNIDVEASTAPGNVDVEAEAWNADRVRVAP